ncbi:30S ribosomal protein S17 [Hydrogenovibrio marinus]|uniref:Small ribosomal subunit protein uS17 n=1 Tax=Hydrogenovibrio marinus TaxID=28885 RepID=A0A067A0A2_HYDMR|nr:30S ribosomal protein S17 [Hydrogenovibrio marinus]KDN95765.1 30S ribosomal protein S17 [Hydrogenovibrio marinus]BBN58752.1 30S ribosomal protein S17 [Hydrogenovibrio marinus]
MAGQENKARTMQGVVVSNGMEKSIVVSIERFIKHSKYKKFVKKSTKLMAHDADNTAGVGDKVTIAECKPLSKNKSWTLVSVDEKAAL